MNTNSNVIVKIIENIKMYIVQKLHLFSCSLLLPIFTSSIFSVHSAINLSANFFLYLEVSWSKYSPTSHDLLHSHSKLLEFQIDPLSHIPLSINSLQPHLIL